MLFGEMNGSYYDNSMGRKPSAWQKCGFNVIAAGTCIYHRPETVKVINNFYVLVKLRSTEQEYSSVSEVTGCVPSLSLSLEQGKLRLEIFAVEGRDYFCRLGLKSYSEWYMYVLNLT
jgi:hypothetical protein